MSFLSYYISTAIPYVNSKPHVGNAQEFLIADALARFHRQRGAKVHFQSGTDDNAFKNVVTAKEVGKTTQDLVDDNADRFKNLLTALNINVDSFVRTSSSSHALSVGYFLSKLKAEDVYRSTYKGLYCQGCEDFFQESDLTNGQCPDHKKPPQWIEEENVFFRLSKYQDQIYNLIECDSIFISPRHRKKEILNFIKVGLKDISLSRSSSRAGGWGIPYPNSPEQVVYVWIDALINYLTGLGFGASSSWKDTWNENTYKIHVIGKNVWKFHAIYWVGLLLSAGLPRPNEILIHGFLTNEGEKISKSLGNGADPFDLIKYFGVDALRFYLLCRLSTSEDSDFVEKNLINIYNSELANKFGNLASRLISLREKVKNSGPLVFEQKQLSNCVHEIDLYDRYRRAFEMIGKINGEINSERPWDYPVESENLKVLINKWIDTLKIIGTLLVPFIPDSISKLDKLIVSNDGTRLHLFPKMDRI
jgi:methionyl-tRNA synthetase